MKRFLIFIALALMTGIHASAQSISINKRFGKVSKEELEMTEYPLDTAATAVFLYESRETMLDLTASGKFMLNTDVHMRIKILKEDGLDWGNFEILRYVSTSTRETVTGIEVVTYNLENGKIVSKKMSRDFIYDEEYSSSMRLVSFYAQDVKVGSVIEVKFKVASDRYWEIDDVYFQRTVPVNLAEVQVRIPGMFTFNKKMRGFHHVDYTSDIEPRTLGSYHYEMGVDKFTAVDIPAFKYEPYIYYPDQYFSAVGYDVRSLTIPGSVYEEYSESWADVDAAYRDSDIMTRFRSHCHFTEDVAALPKDGSHVDNIAAAVNLVRGKVEWNRKYRVFPEPLGQVVKARSGSNADINCLVAGCLREMGYIVEMVMIKARSSGVLTEFQPERFPYDTFVLQVTAPDGSEYYVDGGSKNLYINVLPADFLVSNARLIRANGTAQWIDLTKLSRNSTVMNVTANLTSDLRLEGEILSKDTGNPSYSTKNEYESYGDEDKYIADMESAYSIDIDEMTFEDMDNYTPSASMKYTFSKDLDTSGDYVYINPFIATFHSKDTFQSLKREYPIDFPYAYALTYMFTLPIPEGYAVEQLPENKSFTFGPMGSSVRCIFAVRGNSLQMVFNFSQNNTFCEAVHYEDLRTYWQYLAEIYDSVVVLKKQ